MNLKILLLVYSAIAMAEFFKFSLLLLVLLLPTIRGASSNLFREYIGAEFNNVKFSDVPINPHTQFDFIISFAIDYTISSSHSPTNGKFNIFWDNQNLSPKAVQAIKAKHKNVRVALSLGGDSVGKGYVQFMPSSVSSWVNNAVSSLTTLIRQYHLDGIDIDYEHFDYSDPNTFAECIGQLITQLKQKNIISFASIAPFDDDQVQSHYSALWSKYGNVIDYVNFQFYAYDSNTTVSQFIQYFNKQSSRYNGGGKVLASFITESGGGLSPGNGFFDACSTLKNSGKLRGIFVWCADSSVSNGFQYEKQSQDLLQGC